MAREAAMAEEARSRLGRGIGRPDRRCRRRIRALERTRSQRRVPIEFIKPNPRNPRRHFADAELDELAASIRERGIIQPILARARHVARSINTRSSPANGAGVPRSARACMTCRSWLLEVGDRESLELRDHRKRPARRSQRASKSANGYAALAEEFKYSQDEIAKIVGKSRPHVANTLRLLKLSASGEAYIVAGQLSAGHARLLVGQPICRGARRADRRAWAQRAAGRGRWRAATARNRRAKCAHRQDGTGPGCGGAGEAGSPMRWA